MRSVALEGALVVEDVDGGVLYAGAGGPWSRGGLGSEGTYQNSWKAVVSGDCVLLVRCSRSPLPLHEFDQELVGAGCDHDFVQSAGNLRFFLVR